MTCIHPQTVTHDSLNVIKFEPLIPAENMTNKKDGNIWGAEISRLSSKVGVAFQIQIDYTNARLAEPRGKDQVVFIYP
jgi:hypothetical protein